MTHPGKAGFQRAYCSGQRKRNLCNQQVQSTQKPLARGESEYYFMIVEK
jgi:hypothetical protein